MKIKVWDYLNEYKAEKKEIDQAIEDVLTSGYLILGDKVKSFEEAFSTWCGVNYGVGVDNGTDALFLGLKALNIGAGDEVITVANTAVPTVSAITATGAKAVFVDIDPSSFLIDADKIEEVITSKTKCILPVHLFGQCADMKLINEIAQKKISLCLKIVPRVMELNLKERKQVQCLIWLHFHSIRQKYLAVTATVAWSLPKISNWLKN